jgi:hypothetical protein
MREAVESSCRITLEPQLRALPALAGSKHGIIIAHMISSIIRCSVELITKPIKQGKWSPKAEHHVEVGLSAHPEVVPEVAPDSFMTSLRRGPQCISSPEVSVSSQQQDSIHAFVNWLAGNVSCSGRSNNPAENSTALKTTVDSAKTLGGTGG